jgi:glutathione S-transferase
MYTLYYAPGTASMVVHLALLEIGAPYRLELVDFDAKAQRSPEYLRLNPGGTVPTLIVDGRPLTESAAQLIVLADRHPEKKLAPPAGTPERDALVSMGRLSQQSAGRDVPLLVLPAGSRRARARARRARGAATADRKQLGPARCASRRPRALHARPRILRRRSLRDDADALVAPNAASRHRMAGDSSARLT